MNVVTIPNAPDNPYVEAETKHEPTSRAECRICSWPSIAWGAWTWCERCELNLTTEGRVFVPLKQHAKACEADG